MGNAALDLNELGAPGEGRVVVDNNGVEGVRLDVLLLGPEAPPLAAVLVGEDEVRACLRSCI